MKPARLRALLIDDEPPAREMLRALLAVHAARVEIVGEARSVAEAATLCARLRPDLLFLDIHLPREDGFALLPRLASPPPAIIFVTAHDAFAVRAFEVNALDYLLKPVAPARLAAALDRVGAQTVPPPVIAPAAPSVPALAPTDTVLLRSDHLLRAAPVASITHVEAEENYTRVHLADAPPMLVRRPLAEWEKLLPAALFVRVERSLLVNLRAVRALDARSRDEARLHLAGLDPARPLLLARRASLRLRQALEALDPP
jgi:two-component system LytT family response regulator